MNILVKYMDRLDEEIDRLEADLRYRYGFPGAGTSAYHYTLTRDRGFLEGLKTAKRLLETSADKTSNKQK